MKEMSEIESKYQALMQRYKETRLELGPDALPYLEAAEKLLATGKVSKEVVIGSAYL